MQDLYKRSAWMTMCTNKWGHLRTWALYNYQNNIKSANRSLYLSGRMQTSKLISHEKKLRIYNSIINQHSAESRILFKNVEQKRITLKKVLSWEYLDQLEKDYSQRRTCWRIKQSREKWKLFRVPDVVVEARRLRLK